MRTILYEHAVSWCFFQNLFSVRFNVREESRVGCSSTEYVWALVCRLKKNSAIVVKLRAQLIPSTTDK